VATFTKVCLYCRQPFEAKHDLANICSPDCRRTQQARMGGKIERELEPEPKPEPQPERAEALQALVDSTCLRCGRALVAEAGARTYCSVACKRALRHRARRELVRRARVEAVSMAVLRVRDQDTCRLCGEPVDFSRRSPDPRAATIDHVVALSKGGAHSYENTQLAHLWCNTVKGAG
jgi:hypothetical protein